MANWVSSLSSSLLLLSSKTPYWLSQQQPFPVPQHHQHNPMEEDYITQQCELQQLNYVIRHGTRYPTTSGIEDIKLLLKKMKKLASLPEWIQNWEIPYDTIHAGNLAEAGTIEMRDFGHRIRKKYAPHFPPHYSRDTYRFRHTYKLRTKQSATSFAYGYFDGFNPIHYDVAPAHEDQVLRFFDNCQRYEVSISDNKTAYRDCKDYLESPSMKKHVQRFNKLYALKAEKRITPKELAIVYQACSFDVALYNETTKWCQFLDAKMFQSLDYYKDLKAYWKKGYGHALDWEIATPLIRDIHTTLLEAIENNIAVKGNFRFAHAETLLPLICMLLHKSPRDTFPLKAGTPPEQAFNRFFRTSRLVPFAANVGFLLYRCNAEAEPASTIGYRIKVVLNEHDLHLPGCKTLYCTVREFQDSIREYLYEWDYAQQCHVK